MTEIRHTIEALLNPFFLILVLVCITVFFSWQIIWARRVLLISLVLLILFSTSLVPAYLIKKLESIYQPVTHFNPSIKTIVVLSGGQADVDDQAADSVLFCSSIKRLLAGVRIWKAIPKATLVLSGGGYGHQTSEAVSMQSVAVEYGVPSDAIRIEEQSLNTEAQARLLKQILGDKPFYLVTSAIHMPRSMALFQDQGLHPIAAPANPIYYWQDERWQKRYIPNAHNLVYTEIALHELLGLLYRYIKKSL